MEHSDKVDLMGCYQDYAARELLSLHICETRLCKGILDCVVPPSVAVFMARNKRVVTVFVLMRWVSDFGTVRTERADWDQQAERNNSVPRGTRYCRFEFRVGNGPKPVARFRFSAAEKMRFVDCVPFSQREEETSKGGLMYRNL